MQAILRWFCHFDDDQYVNVKILYKTLLQYDSNKDYYLGKSSIEKEIEIEEKSDKVIYLNNIFHKAVVF